jgi:hypothetical protein
MNNFLKCLFLQGFLLLFSFVSAQKNNSTKVVPTPTSSPVKILQGNRKITFANVNAIEAPKAIVKMLVTVNAKGEIISSSIALGTTINKDNSTIKLIIAELKNIQFNEAAESKVLLEFKTPMARYTLGQKKIDIVKKQDSVVPIKSTPIITNIQGDTFKIKMNNYFASSTNAFKILAEEDARGTTENINNKFLFFYPSKVILVVDSNVEAEWKITKRDNNDDELVLLFEKGDKLTYSENEMTIIEKSINLSTRYMVAPINKRR